MEIRPVPRRLFLFMSAAAAVVAFRRGQRPPAEFDYIIVGAGSSGCVLANRLSANPQNRVLLIEAGGPEVHPDVAIPGRWTSLLGTELDWGYETEPEPGLNGRRLKWPRGKSHGGSSTINAMAYTRGHELCYARWAAEAGADWGFRSLLPLFRQVEHNTRGASDRHGTGGPLVVADTTDPHAGHLAFLGAAREHGFTARPDFDFDGPRQEHGAGFYQKNIKDGRRHSVAAAFLVPALGRPNLTVWSHARATQVLIDGHRASGVRVIRNNAVADARAAREVILCAGAIDSPRLLMLSGIGPADDLRRAGIRPRLDAPDVGANLQDHLRISVRWHARTPIAASSVSAGLFTYSSQAAARRHDRPPDLQFYVGRGLDVVDQFVTLTVAMTQPESRGRITLRGSDPLAPAVIRANYLSASGDLEAMVEGLRLALRLGSSRAYDALRGEPVDPEIAAATAGRATRGALEGFIQRAADTIFHPACTCRMGQDSRAVLDPQLRVRGINGLRVVDASSFPSNLNSQIHAACVVIGEKAAEMIHD